ncbi:MAG: 16S rRNA (cytidine(1402)-2'-O)-methyltransferase [Deltaproteobacteria bacterium]|nr:16S rRNA (cytidine(1402)-2'-O)-methyltransferase [Deltaproteobacteria bacterium]
MAGKLFVVATPIGNMEDITLRAIRVLKEVSLIAAEDTRRTKKLLAHYGIDKPLTSYFEHNEKEKAPLIIEKIKGGMDIALVSDAGTPGISDPGYRLVKLAVENSVTVVAIPGPSALVSALSVSGLPLDEFTFKGFLPSNRTQLRKFLLGLKGAAHTYVVYESARRAASAIEAIEEVLGDIEVIIAREMTKLHEEVMRGRAGKLREALSGRELKGEVTMVLRTGTEEAKASTVEEELLGLLESGFALKDAAKAVAGEFGLPKSEVYKKALEIKGRIKKA